MLETAEYERPASDETLDKLASKLVFECLELINPTSGETADGHGRLAVLSPESHVKFFQEEPFIENKNNPKYKERVAGEFGDVLWYMVAMLSEKDVTMKTVIERCFTNMETVGLDISEVKNLSDFSNSAAKKEPAHHPSGWNFDDNPVVHYMGLYVSRFCRSVSPEHGANESTLEQLIESAADLLWSTTYLLVNFCNTDLQTTLQKTYIKLKTREQLGIAQGTGEGDDHSIPEFKI